MGESIDLTWTSQHNEVANSYNAIYAMQDRLISKVDQIGRKVDAANQKNATGWDKIRSKIGGSTAQLLGFGSGLATIYTATSLIRGEWEKIIAAQTKFKDIRVESGQSFAQMNVNMLLDKPGVKGGVSDVQQFNQMKDALKQQTLLKETEINQVLSNTLSARGSLNVPEMMGFIREAGRLQPGDVEAIETMAARGMDIAKVTGVTDAKKILPSLMELQAASRAVNPADLTENFVTPLLAMMSKGSTFEQSAEFFAGLTQVTADVKPEKSRTGTIAFVKRLEEFMPKSGMEGRRGQKVRLSSDQIQAYEEAIAQSPEAALQVLQQNPQMGEAFLTQAGSIGKGALLPAFQGLVRNEPQVVAQFESAREKIGALGNQQAVEAFGQREQRLRSDSRFQTFMVERGRTIAEEQAALSPSGAAMSREQQVRDIVHQVIEQTNVRGLDVLDDKLSKFDLENYLLQAKQQGLPPEEAGRAVLQHIKEDASDFRQATQIINPYLDQLSRMESTYSFHKRNQDNNQRGNRAPVGGR